MKIKVAGVEILIDEIDVDLIRDYNWCLIRDNYLQGTNKKYRKKSLHRVIAERMTLDVNRPIYHKNNNRLDFRRSNLIDFSPLQESIRKNIQIDECDMDLIRDYNWYLNSCGYLCARIDGKDQTLHNMIAERMGFDLSKLTDHIDRDKENNHRSNLREATHSQNRVNSKKRSDNTSGYRGVFLDKRTGRWPTQIQFKGKQIYLGVFNDKKDAARVYDKAALEYYGEFAQLNFPRKDYQ